MLYTQIIKDVLNILDLNIIFYENCLETKKMKGVISRIFSDFLDAEAQECPHCCFDKSHIIRWGYTTSLIKMPPVSEYPTYLRLKKRRFFCKQCRSSFVLESSVVEKNQFISKNLKRMADKKLSSKHAMTEIAHQTNISTSTVYRVLKEWYHPIQRYSQPLPKVLCFDEFKSVKRVAGAMSFIMMNGETNELMDILPDRRLYKLEEYFNGFPLSERRKVQYIVTDIYKPYIVLAKKLFPKAKVVLDKFHFVQHVGRAFQKIRIRQMNRLISFDNGRHYRRLKKYWKLLQKDYDKLEFTKTFWRPAFKTYLSEKEILERLLSYDDELSQAYFIYQQFLQAFKTKNYDSFLSLLDTVNQSKEYIPVLKTFNTYKQEIKHTLTTSYSNGPLECLNNHIKVLKRNAYGFRSFYNFKLRISICFKDTTFKTPKKT